MFWSCWVCRILGCPTSQGENNSGDLTTTSGREPPSAVVVTKVRQLDTTDSPESAPVEETVTPDIRKEDDALPPCPGPSSSNPRLVEHSPLEATLETVLDEAVVQIDSPVVFNKLKEGSHHQSQIVKVDVHSSSGGSEESGQEHEYEDIYLAQEEAGHDSGKHSRSESTCSTNSTHIHEQPAQSPESGVSSASPSDLGQSEEEIEKLKLSGVTVKSQNDDNSKNQNNNNNTSNSLVVAANNKYNTINNNTAATLNHNYSNATLKLTTSVVETKPSNNYCDVVDKKPVHSKYADPVQKGGFSNGYGDKTTVNNHYTDVGNTLKSSYGDANTLKSHNYSDVGTLKSHAYSDLTTTVKNVNAYNDVNVSRNNVYSDVNGSVINHNYSDLNGPTKNNSYSDVNGSVKNHNYSDVNGSTKNYSDLNTTAKNFNNNDVNGTLKNHNYSDLNGTKNHHYSDVDNGSVKSHNYSDISGPAKRNSYGDLNGSSKNHNYCEVNPPSRNNYSDLNIKNHTYSDVSSTLGSVTKVEMIESISSTLTTASIGGNSMINSITSSKSLPAKEETDIKKSEDLTDNIQFSLPTPISKSAESSPQNTRALKRVVSEPANMCPPPPPPPPPLEEPVSLPSQHQEETIPPPNNYATVNSSEMILPPHTIKKQMVLPFIPPKFNSDIDPNALIKPSEYLRSISGGGAAPGGGAGATQPSAQGAASPQEDEVGGPQGGEGQEPPAPSTPPPPPPPQPAPATPAATPTNPPPGGDQQTKTPQPLSSISIHDLNSVQLRRTKTPAYKTMSCPPKSLTGIQDQPFQAQKEDLIAELKASKDITGIKKMKVERVKMEQSFDKEVATELSKQFSVENFVEKMPDKDSLGNPIPPWKRQMLAKKAAEKARKEMEEQIAKEAEEKRLQAIPPWKRHLMASKGRLDEKTGVPHPPPLPEDKKAEVKSVEPKPMEDTPENKENSVPEATEIIHSKKEDDTTQIIPWRAQLRKTNSTLNLLE